MVDNFENLFVKVYPDNPYSITGSSARKSLIDFNPSGRCLFFELVVWHQQARARELALTFW